MSMKSKAKKPKVNKVDVKEEEVVAAPAPAEDRLLQEDSDNDEYVVGQFTVSRVCARLCIF